jgi:hypothetical protein
LALLLGKASYPLRVALALGDVARNTLANRAMSSSPHLPTVATHQGEGTAREEDVERLEKRLRLEKLVHLVAHDEHEKLQKSEMLEILEKIQKLWGLKKHEVLEKLKRLTKPETLVLLEELDEEWPTGSGNVWGPEQRKYSGVRRATAEEAERIYRDEGGWAPVAGGPPRSTPVGSHRGTQARAHSACPHHIYTCDTNTHANAHTAPNTGRKIFPTWGVTKILRLVCCTAGQYGHCVGPASEDKAFKSSRGLNGVLMRLLGKKA